MTIPNEDYRIRLRELIATCAMNQRYHQALETKFQAWDRWVKIAVAFLTAIGATLAMPAFRDHWLAAVTAAAALFAAIAVNCISWGDAAKKHGELFRLWTDLRKDAGREEFRTSDCDVDKNAVHYRCQRLEDLLGKMVTLNGTEPAADEKLLHECHLKALQELGIDSESAATSEAALAGEGAVSAVGK